MAESPAFWQCPKCKTPNPWAAYLTQCVACGGPRPAKRAAPIFVPPAPPTAPKPPARKGRVAVAASSIYLGIVVAALILTKTLGDRWWPATLLLFGPRWLFLFPILPIAAWLGFRRRWGSLGMQAAALAIVAGPLMGLRVPITTLFAARPRGELVRVLSLNRGTGPLDSRAFARLVENGRYDLVCIQEARADPVLDAYFATTRWYRDQAGTIWSRFPIVEDLGAFSGNDFEVRGAWPARLSRVRVRLVSGREVVVANAHLPTMSNGFLGITKGDFAWVRYYTEWRRKQTIKLIDALRQTEPAPVILAGDFNMPPDSPFMGQIRDRYTSGFEAAGWGYGYTRPSRLCWIGIDRVLASPECTFVASRVGPRVGSDHRPIDAEVIVPFP